MSYELEKHPIIPETVFAGIVKNFQAIDTTLSLHYSTHTTDPVVVKLLDDAASLAQKRIKVSDLEIILSVDPMSFIVYKTGVSYHDYKEIYIRFPNEFKPSDLQRRKIQFILRMNEWIVKNSHIGSILYKNMEDFLKENEISLPEDSELRLSSSTSSSSSKPSSPSKIVKKSTSRSGSTSPIKRKGSSILHELKNDSSKFKFKEKDGQVEQQKSNGLSLLERIRLKERIAKEQQELDGLNNTPEKKYQRYLLDKCPVIYDMIYQLVNENTQKKLNEDAFNPSNAPRKPNPSKTLSISKLCEIIEDSMTYPIEKKEIIDVFYLMEKLLKDSCIFTIVKHNDVAILKAGGLERDRDLNTLKRGKAN
ncbi:uncharacterized protein RJT20DRAFT_130630 [Scheffersomyces xylosifermentans]|uniref:uncharacterized protein n=1 Tax=Scheffersomyces xylosifermentans TaxID=1304137 RepID=UPI00315C5B16